MWLALTGTPGTGKTAVADVLRTRGVRVVDLNGLVRDRGLILGHDDDRDTDVADIDGVTRSLEEEHGGVEVLVVEGHWSHKVQVTGAVVLRCDPRVLRKRLEGRGYARTKVDENVEAELVDFVLIEAIEALGKERVAEMDSTDMGVGDVATAVTEVLNGNFNRYKVGSVDWSGQLME